MFDGTKLPNIVYIHIGKTSGTSLRASFVDAIGAEQCSEAFRQSHMVKDEADHYHRYQVICGHISREDQLKWFPDYQTITTLREPIDRCLSFLHYVRSLPPEAWTDPAHRDLPLMEYIETEGALQNLSNTMVRQLGGHMLDLDVDLPVLFEKAKETLRTAFWVGRQERMESDIRKLGDRLGIRLRMRRENVTVSRPPMKMDDPAIIDKLRSINTYDIKLWDWAAEYFA